MTSATTELAATPAFPSGFHYGFATVRSIARSAGVSDVDSD